MNKFSAVLQSLTATAHGDTLMSINNSSNIRPFMRTLRYVNGVATRVPTLSANSFRSVAIRRPLADHLVATTGVNTLPKTVVNLLYSGGNLMSGAKSPNDEFALAARVRTLLPSLELLSGAVDDFVLPAGCLRLFILPVAAEYADSLKVLAPELANEAEKISIFDLITEETRTRGTGEESEGNQMIYTYEVLAGGTKFYVEFRLTAHASSLCKSALGFALQNWDGIFGGQSRQGRGFMNIQSANLPDSSEYADYVETNKEALANYLIDGTLGSGKVLCGGK